MSEASSNPDESSPIVDDIVNSFSDETSKVIYQDERERPDGSSMVVEGIAYPYYDNVDMDLLPKQPGALGVIGRQNNMLVMGVFSKKGFLVAGGDDHRAHGMYGDDHSHRSIPFYRNPEVDEDLLKDFLKKVQIDLGIHPGFSPDYGSQELLDTATIFESVDTVLAEEEFAPLDKIAQKYLRRVTGRE